MEWKEIVIFLGATIITFAAIYLIFSNFWISRILSLVGSGFLIYLTVTMELAERVDKKWTFILLATLSWLLFRGEKIFEVEFTGFLVDYGGGWFAETTGGIFENTAAALIVTGLLYYFAAPNYPYFYYVIPGFIILMDIISFCIGPD